MLEDECCCKTADPCPTNCDCGGQGVVVQMTAEVVDSPGNICGFSPIPKNVVGTVSDANGTWKFVGMALDGASAVTGTTCGTALGAKKSGVAYYFDFNDFENPCVVAGTQTLNYLYQFGCVGDGTVSLSVYASLIGCSFDGLTYYGPNIISGTMSFLEECISTPTCDGSNLTADFTFNSLSGGQDPPSGSASISLNLTDAGYHCCQTFHVVDTDANPIEGAVVAVSFPALGSVTRDTDAGGDCQIAWNQACTADLTVEASGYATHSESSVVFVRDETTTIVLEGGFGLAASSASEYPPLLTQAASAIKAAGRFVASGLKTTDQAEQARRLAICGACEHFDPAKVRCRKCGCYANLKARIASQHCPIDKW